MTMRPNVNTWGPERWDYQSAHPKASYVAMNTLSSTLRRHRFARELDLPGRQFAYTFNEPGAARQTVAAWNEGWTSSTYLVPTDAKRAFRVDIMGGRTPLPIVDGFAPLEVSVTPSFLVLEGGSKAVELGPTFASALESDDETRSVAELHNPFSRPVKMRYRWRGFAPLRTPGNATGEVTLAPGERKRVETGVELVADRSFALGEAFLNRLELEIPALDLKGAVEVWHRVKAVSAPRGDYTRAPSLVIESQSQIVNRFEHDPHTIHLMWKGWEDSQGLIHFARDGEDLKMRVAVRDNRHQPAPAQADPREGDAVLIYLAHNGGMRAYAVTERDGQPVVSALDGTPNAALPTVRLSNEGGLRVYELRLSDVAEETRFNVVLVDHDGAPEGIESYGSAAPGGLPGQIDSANWPRLLWAK